MRLHTASEVISLARKLEQDAAAWYEQLAAAGIGQELAPSFSAENRRFADQVERAYYGIISDAIEGGFAFDLETNDYSLPAGEYPEAWQAGTLGAAIWIERMMARFYSTAAEQSGDLLADMPRVFKQIVKKRMSRLERLDALLRAQT